MADEPVRSRLGRGLASLIGDMGAETNTSVERARSQRRVSIEFLHPNPRNPRRHFAALELDELAASIKQRGVIHGVNLFAFGEGSIFINSTMKRGQRIGRLEIGLHW